MSCVSSAGLVISTSGRDHGLSPPVATLSLLIIYMCIWAGRGFGISTTPLSPNEKNLGTTLLL